MSFYSLTHSDRVLQHLFSQSTANAFQVHVGMVGRAKRMVDLTSAFVHLDLKEAIVKVSVSLWSVTKIKENVNVILEKKNPLSDC